MTPTQRAEGSTRTEITGKISNSTLFTTPLYAMLQQENGHTESVRLLGMGDVEGHSPCYLFVGEDGISGWDSQAKFLIIDPTCLPASRDALANLGRTLVNANETNASDSRR